MGLSAVTRELVSEIEELSAEVMRLRRHVDDLLSLLPADERQRWIAAQRGAIVAPPAEAEGAA